MCGFEETPDAMLIRIKPDKEGRNRKCPICKEVFKDW